MTSKLNSKKIKITPKIAEVCGIHVGDGYLRNDGKRRELDISGSYEEKSYYDNHVIPLFNEVFNQGIKGRFFPHRRTYGFVIRDLKVIEFMHMLGFPYGNKSTKVEVPNFIFGRKLLMKSFLRGYFDTDGHLGFGKKYGKYCEFKRTRHCYPRIMLNTVSKRLGKGLGRILENLNLHFVTYSVKPPKETESLKYRFEINGIKSVRKWLYFVGTCNPTKYSRYQIWKKFGFCPTKTKYKERLEIIKGKLDPSSFYTGPMV